MLVGPSRGLLRGCEIFVYLQITFVWSSSAQVRGWFPSLQHWHVVCMETAPRQLGVNLGGRVIKSLCDPSARNKQFWHANFYRIERGNNIGNFVPRPSFNVGVRKKWKIINVQSILILRLCLVIFEFVMGTWEVVTEISNKNTLLNTDTMLCLHKFRRDQHKQFIQPSTTTTSVATQVDISGFRFWIVMAFHLRWSPRDELPDQFSLCSWFLPQQINNT